MPVQPWVIGAQRELFRTHLFTLYEHQAHSVDDTEKKGKFYYFDMPKFVNVIAITREQKVVMVKQFRHGIADMSLEIPGGLVDAGEEFLHAGVRELREETGGVGSFATQIGVVDVNPAIQNNQCATILVTGVELHEQALDHNEEIDIVLVDVDDIPKMVANGTIRHSLVIAAFYHWDVYRRAQTFDAQ